MANITNAEVDAAIAVFNAAYPGYFAPLVRVTDVEAPQIDDVTEFLLNTATPTSVSITYLELLDEADSKRIVLYAEALALAAAVVAGDYGPLTVVTTEDNAPVLFTQQMEYLTLNANSVLLSYSDISIDERRNSFVDMAEGFTAKVDKIGVQIGLIDTYVGTLTAPHSSADYSELISQIREIYEVENF